MIRLSMELTIFGLLAPASPVLAKDHQRRAVALWGALEADPSFDVLESGSYFGFPNADAGVTSMRSSKCTLEKDIFFPNRSKITNPARAGAED